MSKKYKLGYTCGCFDLFHIGHLNLLERCKNMCDTLIVGICSDNYIREYKNREPIYNQEDRKRIVEALKCVDKAIIVETEDIVDKTNVQECLGFDVLFNGDDWKGTERSVRTEEEFNKIGVSVEYFSYTQGISTSKLREKIDK